MPALDPALLGVTAENVPLVVAALHVACIRAPHVVFKNLDELVDATGPGFAEVQNGLAWLVAKCSEPGGLGSAYQDPESGELHRLPQPALWRAVQAVSRGDAADADDELAPFRIAAQDALGLPTCRPGLDIVVRRAELDAVLGPEAAMSQTWIATHLAEIVEAIQSLVERKPDTPIANWARGVLEHQLPMLVEIQAALWGPRPDPKGPIHPRLLTKDVVAAKEADFRRRWETQEFETSQKARAALVLELNSRKDGSVSRPGDPDHHTKATVDRLTRGWFEDRGRGRRARDRTPAK